MRPILHHQTARSFLLTLPILLIAASTLDCAESPAPPPPAPAAPVISVDDKTPRQVHLEIFADDKDPATAAFLKDLDATLAKAFTPEQLRRRVLNPGDKTNYARLTAFEKAASTKQFASVEAFLSVVYDYVGPDKPDDTETAPPPPPIPQDAEGFAEPHGHPLALIGKEDIAARLHPAIRVLLHPNKGLLSVTQPELLKTAAERLLAKTPWGHKLPADFPGTLNPLANGVVKTWKMDGPKEGDEPLPNLELTLLFYPIDCPVCSDTELLVLTVNNHVSTAVSGVEAIRPIEKSGVAIPAEAQKFLAQFVNQPLDGQFKTRAAKLDGISGATKTAHNVKFLLETLDEKRNPPTPPSPHAP